MVAGVTAAALVVLAVLLVRDPTERTTPAPGSDSDRATASVAEPSAAPAVASSSPIQTSSSSYFGRPFETIQIPGRYVGARAPTTLRVQVRRGGAWRQFPLPAVTRPSGRFRAYVELGPGRHRLRLVDPDKDRASRVVNVLVF